MPLVVVNAEGCRPVAAGAQPLDAALVRALASLPRGAPVTVMIHGYRFSPSTPGQSPHTHILALAPDPGCWKAVSWPRHLGIGGGADEGLAVAFGWEARGTLWRAYAEAERAGQALADLLSRLTRLAPGRRVGVLTHSLGARVVLSALVTLDRPAIGRAILLAAAEFRAPAEAALATRAGRAAEIVNVTSRENDLFDFLIEALMPRRRDRTLGRGLPAAPDTWLDLQLDHGPTLAALAALGHRIAPPGPRVCHWSAYLRPGVFGLYRALLHKGLPLEALRTALPRARSPRWSRLISPGDGTPLRGTQDIPS